MPFSIEGRQLNGARTLTLIALLAAVGIVLHLVEAAIPLPVQLPGVKLGLANIVTMVAFFGLGRREALAVALMRVVLGSLLSGTLLSVSFFLSLGGALAALAVLTVIGGLAPELLGYPGLSMSASVGHVVGQLSVAAVIINHPGIFTLAPLILISAVLTGFLTGLVAEVVLAHLAVLGIGKVRR